MTTTSNAIHRFTIKGGKGLQKIDMPVGAHILRALAKPAGISIWAIVDPSPDAPQEKRYFQLFTTGEHLPEWIWDALPIDLPGVDGAHLFTVDACHLKPKA